RSQVVVAEPAREFAWEVNEGWVRWGFRLEPTGETGTRLTQDWRFLPRGIAGFGEKFGERTEAEIAQRSDQATSGIPVTLAAIKASAEGN
ncbi:MAG: SRPBCC family protein, partial [Mycolicibacterium sp.]|nr:SRPBCC family protein [Mycolicibacterium sp.]